jgi:hypothetical protein
LIIAAISTTSILESTVPMLNGNNFSKWKENLLFYLGCLELDLELREDEPLALTDTSTPLEVTKHERWEQSNCLSLMFMKSHVTKGIRGSIPECKKATEFMRAVEEQFVSSDKAFASTLMKKLSSKTFDKSRSMQEHIMEMRDMAAQLKSLEVDISESFLVHFILNSLPTEYTPFKISYNTYKDKWSVNELLTMCVQEEKRLKHEKPQSVHFVAAHDKGKSKRGKGAPHLKKYNKLSIKKNDNKGYLFLLQKIGAYEEGLPKV